MTSTSCRPPALPPGATSSSRSSAPLPDSLPGLFHRPIRTAVPPLAARPEFRNNFRSPALPERTPRGCSMSRRRFRRLRNQPAQHGIAVAKIHVHRIREFVEVARRVAALRMQMPVRDPVKFITTSSFGPRTGRDCISAWSKRLKMVAFIPIASPSVSTAITVKPGFLHSPRNQTADRVPATPENTTASPARHSSRARSLLPKAITALRLASAAGIPAAMFAAISRSM